VSSNEKIKLVELGRRMTDSHLLTIVSDSYRCCDVKMVVCVLLRCKASMVKWVTGTFVPAYFRSRERKFHRWNFRSRCAKFVFLAATRALLRPIGL